ncbi:MAG TPA: methionine--tRNA ligase [Fimbriimonadaceae bacterium]|nr:methionine--tRNA ligase [Fimbriimonadaceae bacterium]
MKSITTAIFYVNDVPHLGHAAEMFIADVMARYYRLRGEEVMFLTGTDEHGTKVLEAAERAGKSPQEHVDGLAARFEEIWRGMNFSYDRFIRTTDPRHEAIVQKLFTLLKERGHIYAAKYEGWYDVGAEAFIKESELVDGKSPDGNEVRWVEEENWFFRLSAFADRLKQHIEANPEFIVPEARRNEVLSFIHQGLRDVCITRANVPWGVPVPGEPDKTIYVWFDALINYISAFGWPDGDWIRYWPATVQVMGKDILTRFHATMWPAMLMGAEIPLPETLLGHSWLMIGGEKASKSKGNVIPPLEFAEGLAARAGCAQAVAVDAVRYYLGAALPFDSDTVFTHEEFDRRYNADLANDLGNALNRTLAMAHKFVGGTIPGGEVETEVTDRIMQAKSEYAAAMEEFRLHDAMNTAMDVVRFLNKYIDTKAPWALAKSQDPHLATVMRSMLSCLRASEGLLRPMIPATCDAVAAQLRLLPTTSWDDIGSESSLPAGHPLGNPAPIFPRLELAKPAPKEAPSAAAPEKKPKKPAFEPRAEIEITDFMNVQLRIARILEAEPVEGSEKLVKLQVILGDERRQILAGIRKSYDPADLVGRQVVVVANLKPAKLMGHESQGMILAADGPDGAAILLTPEAEAPEGTSVH